MFDFPYLMAGFKEDEWESISRGDKVMVRDYHLHGGNVERASFFGFFETDRSMREVRTKYDLREKPLLLINLASLINPFPISVG